MKFQTNQQNIKLDGGNDCQLRATTEDAFHQLVLWSGVGGTRQTFMWVNMDREYAPDEPVEQLGTIHLETQYALRDPSLVGRGLQRETRIDVDGRDSQKRYTYRLNQDGSTSFVEIVDGQERSPTDSTVLDQLIDTLNYNSVETEGGPSLLRSGVSIR